MMYSISEAVTDMQKEYPTADLKDIEDVIIKTIEFEILPNILLNISLPDKPSLGSMKLLELRSRRRGNRGKEIFKRVRKNVALIKNFEYVKSTIQYRNYANNSHDYILYNGSSNQILPDLDNKYLGETDYNHQEMFLDINNEYIRPKLIYEIMKPHLIIDIKNPIIEKIQIESTFKNFLKTLEKSLRKHTNADDIMNININQLNDYEISSWEKIIIKLKTENDDFDKNIYMWNEIQENVRKDIKIEMNELSSVEKDLFKEYLKNLYFHMQFMEE